MFRSLLNLIPERDAIIVFILEDDVRRGALSCKGHPARTPNNDRVSSFIA